MAIPPGRTDFFAEDVALKYKVIWKVEEMDRNKKSVRRKRPIYHKRDQTVHGNGCSFLRFCSAPNCCGRSKIA